MSFHNRELGVFIWSWKFHDILFVGQDDAGGATLSPQDRIELGRQLVNEVEVRTSEAIQSGEFTKCVLVGRILDG